MALMMDIQKNVSLKNYNTFGVDVKCHFFVEIQSVTELLTLLADPAWQPVPKLILGGGSNILFSKDFPGLVIKLSLKGIEKVAEDADHVLVRSAAGESWHQLVMFSLNENLAGIENLSLIPGTVGAAPIQNIGAYGVNLKDVFHQLTALEISTGKLQTFDSASCHFGYRDSIFKNEFKNRFIILDVTLKLNKSPIYRLEYGAIKTTLTAMQINTINIQTISEAIIQIRQQKLPDPKKIGNAGSFFKNPILAKNDFLAIQQNHPDLPYFVDGQEHYKISAGWLIEKCGWKGHRSGDTGVHKEHALVLVNYAKGSGLDIKLLAEKIQTSVKDKFSIDLLPEVNII